MAAKRATIGSVARDVSGLATEFGGLRTDFSGLRTESRAFQGETRAEFVQVREEFVKVRDEAQQNRAHLSMRIESLRDDLRIFMEAHLDLERRVRGPRGNS
jgi:hypothetical protein